LCNRLSSISCSSADNVSASVSTRSKVRAAMCWIVTDSGNRVNMLPGLLPASKQCKRENVSFHFLPSFFFIAT
jgi:hypothetical protein